MLKRINKINHISDTCKNKLQPISDVHLFTKTQINIIDRFEPAIVRAIPASQAHRYLGMNRHRFDQLVRTTLKIIPLGKKGAVYDRLDLDAWFEDYKSCNGRPAGEPKQRGKKPWDEKERQDSTNGMVPGTLTNKYKGSAFAKAQERLRLKKRNVT